MTKKKSQKKKKVTRKKALKKGSRRTMKGGGGSFQLDNRPIYLYPKGSSIHLQSPQIQEAAVRYFKLPPNKRPKSIIQYILQNPDKYPDAFKEIKKTGVTDFNISRLTPHERGQQLFDRKFKLKETKEQAQLRRDKSRVNMKEMSFNRENSVGKTVNRRQTFSGTNPKKLAPKVPTTKTGSTRSLPGSIMRNRSSSVKSLAKIF